MLISKRPSKQYDLSSVTYRKARKSDKRRSYLSLPCNRSIGRQALWGLDFLHGKDFEHSDLKPQNILVTKWDARTDTPIIKLADFSLAGIGSEHQTLCGTEGYIAPDCHNNALMGPLAATRDENFSVAILTDHAGPRGASSSMQDVARRLLAALQAEGYSTNIAVAGNSTDEGVIREKFSRLSI